MRGGIQMKLFTSRMVRECLNEMVREVWRRKGKWGQRYWLAYGQCFHEWRKKEEVWILYIGVNVIWSGRNVIKFLSSSKEKCYLWSGRASILGSRRPKSLTTWAAQLQSNLVDMPLRSRNITLVGKGIASVLPPFLKSKCTCDVFWFWALGGLNGKHMSTEFVFIQLQATSWFSAQFSFKNDVVPFQRR